MVRPFAVLAMCIICFLLVRNAIAGGPYRVNPAETHLQDGVDVKISGYLKKIEYSKDKTLLYLTDSIVSPSSEDYPAGTVILSISDNKKYSYGIGGLVYGRGKYYTLSPATNPGQFDEYGYYKSIGVDGRVSGEAEYEDYDGVSRFKTLLSGIRLDLSDSVDNSLLSDEDRSVIKAMVLGDKSELAPELKELYKNAGIIHLISISGLHITIIGMALYKLLRRAGRSFLQAGVISAIVMMGFVIMTGASVSSLRALISFVVLLGAEIFGRTSDPLNTLSLAAFLLLISDGGLLYNPSFLLSFSCVMGIAFFSDAGGSMSRRERLTGTLRTGFGLWLFTLPVLLSVYFEFPLYSVFANLIVVALSPVLLGCGLAGTLTGLFFVPAGDLFFFIAGLVLKVNHYLTLLVSSLPCSVLIAGKPGIISIIAYYGGVAALIYLKRKERRLLKEDLMYFDKKRRIQSLRILSIAFMLAVVLFHPPIGTRITFLDVGQGDSILIRCDNGANIMIDAGSGNVTNVGDKRIIPCLKSYAIAKVDRLILTHPDADHINAVNEILDSNIEVGEILVAEVHSNDEAIRNLRDKVEECNKYSINKTNICHLQRGDMFIEGNTSFTVLYPRGKSRADINSVSESDMGTSSENDRNITSIVVEMECGNTKALFTGDLEKEGEEDLIQFGQLDDVDILKVGHHGSRNATSDELLSIVKPEIAVISCGRNNHYGHPHKETLDRLKKAGVEVYTTPECGAVEVEVETRRVTSVIGDLSPCYTMLW